jgi:outer membrane receptor protein involved in Fe transport
MEDTMMKRILLAILCVAIVPTALLAQIGKISGKVTDANTGEPLIGANVLIVGSDRGAATNLDGEYVILNVPIGNLTLKATYIGYEPTTVSKVFVRSSETTRRDFKLSETQFTTGVVVIEAVKPLVDRQATNTKSVLSEEDLENLPVQGIEGVVATLAGVVSTGGGLNIRGSRSDQTQYVVDGVNATDPTFGGRSISVVNNAIAEISYQAGGYSAEFGGRNAGIISTTTRSGGNKYRADFEVYTDGWGDASKEYLGTHPYGNTRYAATGGGPLDFISDKVKFFVAAQWSDNNNPVNRRKPLTLTSLYSDRLQQTRAWDILADDQKYNLNDKGEPDFASPKAGIFDPQQGTFAEVVDYTYPAGAFAGYRNDSYLFNGNLTFNFNPINIRVGGSYAYGETRSGSGVTTINNQARAGFGQSENYSANFKLTHLLSPKTFYEVYLGFQGNYGVNMDYDHEHNLAAYGDSIANAQYGYNWLADAIPPTSANVFGTGFQKYGAPRSGYGKGRTQSIQGKINFVHQIGSTHEIKIGGDATRYTIRSYSAGNSTSYYRYVRTNPDATDLQIAVNNRLDYYGYDQYGNILDTGLDGPKNPVFASFYALDKIELEDLVINFGLRFEYIDTKSKEFVNENSIEFDSDGFIREDQFKDVEASQTISPRISFSFPVTDETVFYAQYGQFVSQSRLRDVYLGYSVTSSNIQGGLAIQSPVGFGLKPERTTQYDFGFRQQIGDYLGIDIGAFYKDIKDQIQQRQIPSAPGAPHSAYFAWVNGDFTTSTGFNIRTDLRRIERVTASVTYTYSDARGTGSSPSSAFRSLWLSPTGVPFLPKYTSPLAFDQNHTGTINVDYRFGKDDGPQIGDMYLLERLGVNLLFRFNSGTKYTRVNSEDFGNRRTPVESLNESVTPWVFYLDGRIDKTVTIGPLDVNFYIWVINLLNSDNVEGIYPQSGSWTSNGYLASEEGQKLVENQRAFGDVFAELYQDFYYQQNLMNANVYGTPRQIRLGLKLQF